MSSALKIFEEIKELLEDADEMHRGYLRGRCPFHDDKSPSLLVFPDGWWRCLGECNTYGKNEWLLDQLREPGARRRPPEQRVGYKSLSIPPYSDQEAMSDFVWDAHHSLMNADGYRWTFEQRGIDGCIERSKLGWYDGWMIVPILSNTDDVKGVYGRAGEAVEKVTGERFTHSEGQPNLMYVPDYNLLKDPSRPLAVVFGLFDALVLSDLRFPVVSPTSGKDSFDPAWLNDWFGRIYVIPDDNEWESGQKLASKLGWRGHILDLKYDDQVKDPADYAKKSVGRLPELVDQIGGPLAWNG